MLIKFQPKQVLMLIIALSSFQLFAEEKPKEEKPFKRVMIGVHFSPDVAYRVVTKKNNDAITNLIIKEVKNQEIPKFGYTVGVNTLINIKSFVGIEAGIWYMNMGYQIKWREVNFGSQWTGSHNNPNINTGDSIALVKLVYDYHYIGIPLTVNFTVGKGKVRFFAGAGLAVNFLVSNTNTDIIKGYEPKNGKSTNKGYANIKLVNLIPILEAGIDYKINSRMNLKVSPCFKFGALNLSPDTPIGEHLFNGGIKIQYYFGI